MLPTLRLRPVDTPISPPSCCSFVPTSPVSSVGKLPEPTLVVYLPRVSHSILWISVAKGAGGRNFGVAYALTTPITSLIFLRLSPRPDTRPPRQVFELVTYGYVP